jgi:cbb3-type cytochrome oxidase subunit 3
VIDIAFIKITTLLCLSLASIILVLWVFRPKSKELYAKISAIPLIDNNIENVISRERLEK